MSIVFFRVIFAMAMARVFVADVNAMDQSMEILRLSSLEIFVKLHPKVTK